MNYERLRVLVVDDNHHMRLLLAEVLRAIGVRQIMEASDGGHAMGILREHQFDVILTDLVMPDVDGLALMRELRASDNDNRMTPVVVVSGRSTAQAVREARDAGANEFLTKPIAVRSVLQRLHEVVQHGRPFLDTEAYIGPDRRRRMGSGLDGQHRRSDDPEPPEDFE